MINNLEKIVDFYGYEKQSRKTMEELGELTVAINKYIDEPKESKFLNLIEEIADVEIMLQQLKIIHDIGPDVIYDIKVNKIKRQLNRINREKNGKKVKGIAEAKDFAEFEKSLERVGEVAESTKAYKECTFTDFLIEEEDLDEEELQKYLIEQGKQEVINLYTRNFLGVRNIE